MLFFLYILQSENDKGFYIGITQDIVRRLSYHNAGRVRSTRARIPFKVVHTEFFSTRLQARNREKYLKSYRGSSEKLSILDKIW